MKISVRDFSLTNTAAGCITVSADIHIITSGAAAGPILPARSAVYHYDTQTAAYHR